MILERFDSLPQTANDADPEGNCLLHSMIRLDWKYGLEVIPKKPGVETEVHDRLGRSAALHHAATTQDTNVARKLIEKGARISHADFNRRTPLMYALDEERAETIDLLLSNGAECETFDVDGKSPLHYAVSRDWMPMIERLVNNGADINAPDSLGIIPVHLAAFYGNPNVLQ